MGKCCVLFLCVVGLAAAVIAVLFNFFGAPLIIHSLVTERVELKNGSDAYDRWETLPLPVTIKIYFFNILNPNEVSKGAKPNVQEVGPYIYQQWKHKFNITEEPASTLAYNEHNVFKFDANASFPLTDSDEIHIVNLALMSFITITEGELYPLLPSLNKAIPHIFNNPENLFLKTTPKDFLFDGIILNCTSSELLIKIVCDIIDKKKPQLVVKTEDGNFKFSLMGHKNNSDEGRLVIKTGADDIDNLGDVVSFRESDNFGTWPTNTSCDKITGRMGTHYPPFLDSKSRFNLLSVDICRSMNAVYENSMEYSGINGLHFIGNERALLSPVNASENRCFCLNKTLGVVGDDGCLLDGALELWNCQGAPVVFSYPHFYHAHQKYQSGVDGLHPEARIHETFLDIEPDTGSPLKASRRGQFNIFLRPVDEINVTTKLKPTLMPAVWIDETMLISDELLDKLKTEYFDVVRLSVIICWTIFGSGCLLCLIGIFLCFRSQNNKNSVINGTNPVFIKD